MDGLYVILGITLIAFFFAVRHQAWEDYYKKHPKERKKKRKK